MNNQYLNVSCSQLKKIPITLIGLSCLCVTIISCGTQTKNITLASGANGSGYQRISQQIIDSAQDVGNLNLTDYYSSQGSQEKSRTFTQSRNRLCLAAIRCS